MGLFKDWFGRAKAAETRLLDSFLNLEQKRLESQAQQDDRRQALELKKLELEIEHAEDLSRVRREDREAAQKLKQQQREWAATSREKKKQKEATEQRGNTHDCRVCSMGPNEPSLSVEDISWHNSGHRSTASPFS